MREKQNEESQGGQVYKSIKRTRVQGLLRIGGGKDLWEKKNDLKGSNQAEQTKGGKKKEKKEPGPAQKGKNTKRSQK